MLVLPAAVTAIAPVTYITLEKSGDGVKVTSKPCLLMVVPFNTRTLSPVTEISTRVRAARQRNAKERRRDDGKRGTIEGEGHLVFIGPDDTSIEASVSPASIERLEKLSQDFLAAPSDTPLTMFAPANWKFSVIGGVLATGWALLYIVGCSIAIPLWFFKKIAQVGKKVASLGPESTDETNPYAADADQSDPYRNDPDRS